jgi:tagatose-6-phosphate ketose/aldose isomerase
MTFHMLLRSTQSESARNQNGTKEQQVAGWTERAFLDALVGSQTRACDLLNSESEEKRQRGYFHTLHEILQQPWTWLDTCDRMSSHAAELKRIVADIRSLVLTGSGSSEYVGDCVRQALQEELAVSAQVIGGGELLMHGRAVFPPERPGLMVSLARSGDSPESAGAMSQLLEQEPLIRHLVLTCNQSGALAARYARDPRVGVVVLDDCTNDRSLVMTSSLTNLVLAARFLGLLDKPETYRRICTGLSTICCQLFLNHFDSFVRVAGEPYTRAVYLGSGTRWGAARESALKMLEMTSGRVSAISENYLALRHGPMSYITDDTLIVCFLSSDPSLRAYETDLLAELTRKQLGLARVIIGEGIPSDSLQEEDIAIETPGIAELGDENAPVIAVVAGQLLAFSRCLRDGLRPDSPSVDGVINRVVENFTVYDHRSAQAKEKS